MSRLRRIASGVALALVALAVLCVRVPAYAAEVAKIPVARTGLVYTGEEQRGVEEGEGYTLTGDVTQTHADTYAATAVLKDGYVWSDGSSAPLRIEWTIEKATLVASYVGEVALVTSRPALTVSVTGFVNGETAETALGYVAPTVAYGSSVSVAGPLELSPSGGRAADYSFEYQSGYLVGYYEFTDVTSSTAHAGDINRIAQMGITTGWPTGGSLAEFRPYASVVRADMAAFLHRWYRYRIVVLGGEDYLAESSSASFSDVVSSTSHADDIAWLGATRVSTGFADGTYHPYSNVLRCDMAAFLYRMAGSPTYEPTAQDMARFTDVTSATPHAKEIWWLASQGISTGWSDGTFRPYTSVARADMAAFLNRMASLDLG